MISCVVDWFNIWVSCGGRGNRVMDTVTRMEISIL